MTVAQRRGYALELERENAELKAFAHVIAHDLAEGLGTIALFADALAVHLADEVDSDAARDLDGIKAGIARMWSLIDGTLEGVSAPPGPRRDDPVDVNLILREAISSVEARVVSTGAAVVAEPLPWVSGDANQLTRLFQNLLANSLKFRDPLRAPRIRISATPQGRRWRFEVADNGTGIAPEVAERAFGRRSEGQPDAALGLAICRRIVAAHGGKIRAESRPRGGTKVSFDLGRSEQLPLGFEDSPLAGGDASRTPPFELTG